MPTYLGWNVVDIPAFPSYPSSFEFQLNPIVSVNTNPFSGQQQIQYWNPGYYEASVAIQPLTFDDAQHWTAFITLLQGMTNVFHFGAEVCATFPTELTTDGSTPRYWRLKANSTKWAIKPGLIYTLTFEIREAI